jgi:hypothetical protein
MPLYYKQTNQTPPEVMFEVEGDVDSVRAGTDPAVVQEHNRPQRRQDCRCLLEQQGLPDDDDRCRILQR